MPSLLSHYWTGLKASELLASDDAMRTTIGKYKHEFAIGCQGPDLWLYAYGCPWQNSAMNKYTSEFGNWIHNEKTNAFFASCLNTIRETEGEELQLAMVAYVAGFLCHWALDSTVHPFVYYRTNGTDEETKYWHCRYESMLDNFVSEKMKEEKREYLAKSIPVYTDLTRRAIEAIHTNAYKTVWDFDLKPGLTLQALKDFKLVIAGTTGRPGFMYAMSALIEKLLGCEWKYTSHFITYKKDESIDVCNENHQFWTHPCDASEVHHESYWDLMEQGKEKAYKALELFAAALGDAEEEAKLMEYLGDRNYCTGRKTNDTMKYFNSIY